MFQYQYEAYFQFLIDCLMFALVGFGFLSVYLRFHRWMSLAMTLFIIALSCQYYILFASFWQRLVGNIEWYATNRMIIVGLGELCAAVKSSVAILITYGALLGKIDAFQITLLIIVEEILYTLNEAIIFYAIFCRDLGGCFSIHGFGAFFGLTASWIYSSKANCKDNPNNKASYSSSTLAFIGTFFIWIMFPSFNGVNHAMNNAIFPVLQDFRWPNRTEIWVSGNFLWNLSDLAVMNTFLCMTSSVVVTFLITAIIKGGKFSVSLIQNASLAGGIMIAASAEMFAFPYPPLIIGAWAAIMAVLSINYLGPFMEKYLAYYDTRNQFFLHGIASIFGMAASAIACSTLENTYFGPNGTNLQSIMLFNRTAQFQAGIQVLGWAISIGMGFCGGVLMGILFRIWRACRIPEDTFGDHIWWKMVQDETRPKALETTTTLQAMPVVPQVQMSPRLQPPLALVPPFQ